MPASAPPPVAPPVIPATPSPFSPIPALLAILVLALLLGAYFKHAGFFAAPRSFIVASEFSEAAYVYSNGKLTPASLQEAPAPSFTDLNGDMVLFEKRIDGIYGCSSEECARLIDFGKETPGPVPFTVGEDILAFTNPLTGEFQGFTLHTGNPVRIEPAFSVANTVMPAASGVAADPGKANRYLFVGLFPAGTGATLRVCSANLQTRVGALGQGECVAETLSAPTFGRPTIMLLP